MTIRASRSSEQLPPIVDSLGPTAAAA
jgi:hypothetical protein